MPKMLPGLALGYAGGSGDAEGDQKILGGKQEMLGVQVPLTEEPQHSRAAGPAQARGVKCAFLPPISIRFLWVLQAEGRAKASFEEPLGSADL